MHYVSYDLKKPFSSQNILKFKFKVYYIFYGPRFVLKLC